MAALVNCLLASGLFWHGAGLRRRPTCAPQGAVHHPAGHRAVPGADQAASDRVCGQPRAAGAACPAAVLGDGRLVRSAGPGLPAVAPGKEPAVKVAASQGAPLAARRRLSHAVLRSLCCQSVVMVLPPADCSSFYTPAMRCAASEVPTLICASPGCRCETWAWAAALPSTPLRRRASATLQRRLYQR